MNISTPSRCTLVKTGVILALASALLGLLGQLAWRSAVPKGVSLGVSTFVKLLLDWRVLLGLALYALSTVAWLAALAHDELSRLYPIISLNYALVLLAGYFLFGEVVTMSKVIGVVLILLGVAIIAAS
ncbi:MAG: hypothetical protein NZ954_01810 [Thermofilaceae archaeon]|nr:hypothetical protein [Thermofilaceae archaeon]MDW8003407.1 hypothetical protein [Thermofilaceae archaeon]